MLRLVKFVFQRPQLPLRNLERNLLLLHDARTSTSTSWLGGQYGWQCDLTQSNKLLANPRYRRSRVSAAAGLT